MGPTDFTGQSAHSRVLYNNIGFLRYGTSDKTHAAAVVLSLVLFITIVAVIFVGMNQKNREWADKTFSWLGGAFLFIAGVALGKGGTERDRGWSYDPED